MSRDFSLYFWVNRNPRVLELKIAFIRLESACYSIGPACPTESCIDLPYIPLSIRPQKHSSNKLSWGSALGAAVNASAEEDERVGETLQGVCAVLSVRFYISHLPCLDVYSTFRVWCWSRQECW